MTNWDEIRAYFPALARNVYLNTAGGAPLSVRTAVSAKQYYDEGSQYGEARWNDWLARQHAAERQRQVDPRLEEIRWMLEELRVSLFAQALKTPYPVSVKRIIRRWQALGL